MLLGHDLRIGNRALLSYDGIEGIQDETNMLEEHIVTPNDILLVYTHSLKIYPIPITEKILIDRCGMSGNGFVNKEIVSFTTDDNIRISRLFLPSGGFVLQYKELKIPLQGLHHLQNVVYFITGTELKVI